MTGIHMSSWNLSNSSFISICYIRNIPCSKYLTKHDFEKIIILRYPYYVSNQKEQIPLKTKNQLCLRLCQKTQQSRLPGVY